MTRPTRFRIARTTALVMVAALALASIAGPLAAFAAPQPAASTASASVPPAPKGQLEVQLWPSSVSSLLVVSLKLPDTATLPARVRMPLPEGAQVTWAGEIIGTDATRDISRSFTIVDTSGGRAIEFIAEKARALQYEADLPLPTVAGGQVMATMKWVQTTDALGVNPAVKTPAGATAVQITPAPAEQPRTNSAGEALYTLPQQSPALGGGFTLQVAFKQGIAGSASTTSTAQGAGPIPLYALVVILLVVVVAVVVWALRAGATFPAAGDDGDEDDHEA